jgi:hypothetical protein
MYKGKVNIVSKLKRGDLELVIDFIKKGLISMCKEVSILVKLGIG